MQTGRFGLMRISSANVATWWKADRPLFGKRWAKADISLSRKCELPNVAHVPPYATIRSAFVILGNYDGQAGCHEALPPSG